MSDNEKPSSNEPVELVSGPESTNKHKSKKNRNMFILFIFCVGIGGGGAIYLTAPKEVTSQQASNDLDRRLEQSAGQKALPSLANRRHYGEDYANKVEGEVNGIRSRVGDMNDQVSTTNNELTELKKSFGTFLEQYQQEQVARKQRDEDLKIVLDAQAKEQNDLRNQIDGRQGFPEPTRTTIASPNPNSSTNSNSSQPRVKQMKEIDRTEFKLTPINVTKTVDRRSSTHFIPAGAYAPGRIIMGAKTSAAVDAQSDPRPILIRVLGTAKGPIVDGEHTETDTTGCTITASAYGDISSEQGHAKLQEMSCAIGRDEFKTVKVYGYIGHRGSYGVHSEVVMREGDLAAKAFWSGMLANTGESFGLLVGDTSKSAFGSVQTASGPKDAALNMFTGGLDESSTQLSSYYIKRLEQIQPIIPLKAGTPVDIVFMKEVALDTVEGKAAVQPQERQRIPLDSKNSDIAPNNINQQVMDLLKNRVNDAPNKTNWNNEFY